MITLFVIGACRRESKRCRPNLLPIIHAYGANWEHLGEKGVLPGLVEVYTENWGSGLSKQSCRSYYMLPSRLIARLRRIDPELAKLEEVDFSWNKPWKKNLDSMTNIEISEENKEKSAEKHQKMISKFQKDQHDNKIIIYTDRSKSETNQTGVGIIYTTNFNYYQWKAWNLGPKSEIFDAEPFAIKKIINFTYKKTDI